jgi:PGF-pre-PGF domain-containing protein
VATTYYPSYANTTVNWTGLFQGIHYYNVTANDSATNSNTTPTYTFVYDVTDPIATLSCSPSSVSAGALVTCTCSGTDNISGINSALTSAATTPSTSSTGTFTVTGCSVTDYAGNSDTATDTYTVTSGGGSGSPEPPKKTHSWTKITPGAATIMKDFDEELGIKQISIEVNNPAQNVKITVTKYDGKPANVSVEKSGKVYRYLHVEAKNLNEKLKKGIVRVQVEKSWISNNGLEIANLSVFKFNGNSNKWDELNTNYVEADDDYYYYDAEVDAFSYFAISEKTVVDEEGEEKEDKILSDEVTSVLKKWWFWLIIGVVVVLIVLLVLIKTNKKVKKFFKKR